MLTYTVSELESGKQLKTILLDKLHISKRLLNKLKLQNKIRVNGELTRTIDFVKTGDIITVDINVTANNKKDYILAENLNLEILYQDDCLIAINKRPNMVMHPVSGHQSGTVANGVAHILDSMNHEPIIHPVSRLDRDTSGIVLIALNAFVQEHLIKQMKTNQFHKEYLAIANSCPPNESGTINAPISRVDGSIMLRQVSPNGANAITHYKVIQKFNNASLIQLNLETGRTHQIRVHLKHIGCPIIGDDLYFEKNEYINRQALHAHKVSFIHPIKNERLTIDASLPNDMCTLIDSLKSF